MLTLLRALFFFCFLCCCRWASDYSGKRGVVCAGLMLLCLPGLWLYSEVAATSLGVNIVFLFIVGVLVNGPYTLVSSAVAADLGNHPSLKGNPKAMSTVTGIIDGAGSIGAALQGQTNKHTHKRQQKQEREGGGGGGGKAASHLPLQQRAHTLSCSCVYFASGLIPGADQRHRGQAHVLDAYISPPNGLLSSRGPDAVAHSCARKWDRAPAGEIEPAVGTLSFLHMWHSGRSVPAAVCLAVPVIAERYDAGLRGGRAAVGLFEAGRSPSAVNDQLKLYYQSSCSLSL